MKILGVVPSYEPSVGGGVASCFRSLCKGLVQIGVDVTVYTTDATKMAVPLDVPKDAMINLDGVKVRYFPSTFGPNSLFDSRALSNALKNTVHQYDLVYVSAVWQWIGIDTARICNIKEVPMVIGLHGSFARRLRAKGRWKKVLFHRFAGRRALRRAAAIHLTGTSELLEARDLLNGCPTFLVPNAVDVEAYYPVPDERSRFRKKHGIPQNAPLLMTAGRPDWMKRVDLLIEAIAENPKWYLLIVGPNDVGMARKWKGLSESHGVADRTLWTGYLNGKELLAAYSASDLFALISEDENFGMVVVEALLCGVPVIASSRVGVWQMLGSANVGETVPMNAYMIGKVLKSFVDNSDQWETRANNARVTAGEKFSPRRIAGQMLSQFRSVLGPPVR